MNFKIFIIPIISLLISCSIFDAGKIDRYALVNRHAPQLNEVDVLSPFSVGNGDFAFTADVTGLQTFSPKYENGIPLATMSNWGWHTSPNIEQFDRNDVVSMYNTYGRLVLYEADMTSETAGYFRANPHRLNLGRIGFLNSNDFSAIDSSQISHINQQLDLWTGILKSEFQINDHPIAVKTACHPEINQIAVVINSGSEQLDILCIAFDFPYGSTNWGGSGADWNASEKHTTKIIEQKSNSIVLERQLDETIYYVKIGWDGQAEFIENYDHHYILQIKDKEHLAFTCAFYSKNEFIQQNASDTFTASKEYWSNFWQIGGAVDFSKCTNPQAFELERRIVLSQYLTAIQCSGSLPPQETGLTTNSWYGKFHLEMHWWHAVQFALWGRPELLEKSLAYYESIFPQAIAKAELQGYAGARWPKMTSPDGIDSPSSVGVFLIWQQPHIIYYAELLYLLSGNIEILEKYKELVFKTAEFMASFAHFDSKNGRYVLGPPVIPAQEIYHPSDTINPTFELACWKFGLETAQKWQERLGEPVVEKWQHVLDNLSKLPENNDLYVNAESAKNTFLNDFHRNDHPTLLGALGLLPNSEIDIKKMEKTLEKVMESWNWERTWGWDYPLIAMTAARVGRPDLAIEALLLDVPKNRYLNNGHNFQSTRLPLYLPGNGGLLSAIAMMTAGWKNGNYDQLPGFPKDGTWNVKFEGIKKAL